MENKNRHYKSILLLLLLTLNTHIVFGKYKLDRQYRWDSPVELPTNATAEDIKKIENYNREIKRAKEAHDKDDYYVMTGHIAKALSYRPDHPDNILLEYKMAVAMSQYRTPGDERPLRRGEALKIYEKIINTYDHMQYYTKRPGSGIEHPGIMVPRAAVHAAGLANILYDDEPKARKYAEKALECLQETYKKRRNDILNERRPQRPPKDENPVMGANFDNQLKYWEQRQKDVQEGGDVFGNFEMAVTKVAVRQYGYSFGPPQGIADVASAMSNIIRDYPDTPLSKIAIEYIDRAKNITISEIDEDFFETLDEIPQPTTIDTAGSDAGLLDISEKNTVKSQDLVPVEGVVQPPVEKNIQPAKRWSIITVLIVVVVVVILAFAVFKTSKK